MIEIFIVFYIIMTTRQFLSLADDFSGGGEMRVETPLAIALYIIALLWPIVYLLQGGFWLYMKWVDMKLEHTNEKMRKI